MTISQEKNEKTLNVILNGRLDSTTAGDLSVFLEKAITDDLEKLEFDMSGVDFISSKGLRVLVTAYKNLNGREMVINGANPTIIEVFRLSGLLKVFKVTGSENN